MAFNSSVILFCAACALICRTESSKILAIYPLPSFSHQTVFRALMHELAERGHEVVVITTDPAFPKDKCPQNLTEIDVHDFSYEKWNEMLNNSRGLQGVKVPEQTKILLDVLMEIFKAQINSKDVQKLLNDPERKFDLIFIEACFRPALSLAYFYNAPVIEFATLGGVYGTHYITGAPTNPLVYPMPLQQRIFNLSLWEKITTLYEAYALHVVIREQEQIENKFLQSIFGHKVPDMNELQKKIQLLFLNVHPIWDLNRPVPPNVIYLGGMNKKRPQELPKDIRTYLESSKHGVIYVSFGNNARPSLLPADKLKILKSVLCQLSYNVLLKWYEDKLDDGCENVKVSKWFPQPDLLKHPKVKLFITQGGLQSTDEALAAGVPVIAIPFLGDQWFNAEQYVNLNIGKQINIEDLTEDKLKDAIEDIINNEQTYRNNVVKLRTVMRDQPQSSLERAVWWTEHVLRHGGARHLQAAGAHVSWTEYYALDLIVLLLAILAVLVIGIVLLICFLISRLGQNNCKDNKVKMK